VATGDRGTTRNTIDNSTFYGPVMQARDVTIQALTPSTALAQLPPLIAGFLGRDAELDMITSLLDPAAPTKGIVVSAVAGQPGVGKTALAIQSGHAARARGWFSGGVLFINLHGYDSVKVEAAQALDNLLRALGVAPEHIPPDTEARAQLYRSALARISDPILIIADNASSEEQVRLLLPAEGPHHMIITSRHTLAALEARLIDVLVLDDASGIALLDASLRVARPDDHRITNDSAASRRLVELCGGLPLALQIIAAIMKGDLTCNASELADELAEERRLLDRLQYDNGSGASTLSVEAAFELSYRLLGKDLARLFRAFPVNPGPDVSTAAVAAIVDLPTNQVRRLLSELAKAHLIETAIIPGRWRMHDLLYLYAEKLANAHAEEDYLETSRNRLLGYYLSSADAADDYVDALPDTVVSNRFESRLSAMAWFDAEQSSLVAVVGMASATGRVETTVHLANRLADYLAWRRQFDDLLHVSSTALGAAHRLNNKLWQGMALMDRSCALQGLRRSVEAVNDSERALTLFRTVGDRWREGVALTRHGDILRELRRFDDAVAACEAAVLVSQEIDDSRNEGAALNNLAIALQELHQFKKAVAAYLKALAISRKNGDRGGEALALGNLGSLMTRMDRCGEAIAICNKAIVIYDEFDNLYGKGTTLNTLGIALCRAGRSEHAVAVCEEAITIFQDVGDRQGEGKALGNLAATLQVAHRFKDAIVANRRALRIYQEILDQRGEATIMAGLAGIFRDIGQFKEAATLCQAAIEIFIEHQDPQREAEALVYLADSQLELQSPTEAMVSARRAAGIFHMTGDKKGLTVATKLIELANAAAN
jgi:tetratricopeptide (TPR) repeat protein